MYKLLIAVSVAFAATFYVSQKIGETRHEQERQQKQAEEKLEQEKKRAEREQEQEREREAEQRRALEREERERKRALEAQRKLEVQRKQEREAQSRLEAQRKLETQKKRDEKIAFERKAQQEQREAAAHLQRQKDQLADFDNRLRLLVIDRKKRAREWRFALDQEWYRTQRLVGTPGTVADQEAFDRMQHDLYKRYGELSGYEKVTGELDTYSRGLSEAIFKDDWEEANRLYGIARQSD